MRVKRKYDCRNNGYRTSLISEQLIPLYHREIYPKKVKKQIEEIHKKEQDYIDNMTGECVTYKLGEQGRARNDGSE